MDVAEQILHSPDLPAPFERRKDGGLEMSATIAERKAFLSTKKLTYHCRLRVDDAAQTIRFYEILMEKGSGVSTGSDDVSPGFGFKKETCKTGGKTREGAIEEQSRLFGKDYTYQWDYSTVRRVVEAAAGQAGYRLEVVLREKSV